MEKNNNSGKKTILIVEDESIVAMSIKNKLEKLGFNIPEIISTGQKAINKAIELKPDLILMDVRISGNIDGIEVAKRIREIYKIPIVYLTAYSDEETLKRAKITEPYGYIIKPFEERELRSNVEIALYKHEMESKVKNSEEKYKELIEYANDIIQSVGPDGKFIFVNKRWQDVLGYYKEEINKLKFTDILRKDQIPHCKKVFQDLCNGKRFEKVETIFISKNGEEIFVEGNINSKCVENKFVSTIGIFRDITRDKQKEEKIKTQNQFLLNIIESLSHPFYVIDMNTYTIQLANSVTNINKSIKNQTCYSLIHNKNKPCLEKDNCPLEIVKKTKKPVILEHVHCDSNGNYRNFELHGYPVFDKNNEIIQMIEYAIDITDNKRAQLALEESEIRYRLLFENSEIAIASISKDGYVLLLNKKAAKIINGKPKDFIGKYIGDIVPQDIKTQINTSIQEILSSKYITNFVEKFEIKYINKWFSTTFHPIKKQNGEISSIEIIAQDISELKKTQEELQQKNEEYLENKRELNAIRKQLYILNEDQ